MNFCYTNPKVKKSQLKKVALIEAVLVDKSFPKPPADWNILESPQSLTLSFFSAATGEMTQRIVLELADQQAAFLAAEAIIALMTPWVSVKDLHHHSMLVISSGLKVFRWTTPEHWMDPRFSRGGR